MAHPRAGPEWQICRNLELEAQGTAGVSFQLHRFSRVTPGGPLLFSASSLRHVCHGEQDNTYSFSSCGGSTWDGGGHVAPIQRLGVIATEVTVSSGGVVMQAPRGPLTLGREPSLRRGAKPQAVRGERGEWLERL